MSNPITYVRIDFRCPQSNKDNIFIVPKEPKMIRCRCCHKWHLLNELRQLSIRAFAPLIAGTGQPYEGYVGALKETVVQKNSRIDVITTSNFDNSDEKDSR